MYVLSILFAIAPFAFGMIRAFQTGNDFRLLWIAFASSLGALVIRVIAKTRSRQANRVLAFSALTFVTAALFAGLTGYLLGATAVAGVWGVAFVLAFCWAASYTLLVLSYPQPV
jgi:hypothetical protein